MDWHHPPPERTLGAALHDALAAYGDRELFTFADRRLSLRDVDVESDRVAAALLASGIGRGDKVAIMLAGHSLWAALFFGLLKIGAILVPINTRSRPDEIDFGLVKSGATILFFLRERKGRTDYGDLLLELWPELADAKPGALRALRARRAPRVHTVVDLAAQPMRGTLGFDAFLERASSVAPDDLAAAVQAVQPRDEACVLYTSGTTSVPKGARLHHAGMLRGGWEVASWLLMRESDVYFNVQPVYHSGGPIGAIIPPLVSGCRLVTQPYFDATDALAALDRELVTVLAGHQPHFVEYMNHPTLAERRLAIERALVIAPPDTFWLVRDKLGIEGLVSGYGMTETHIVGTHTSLETDPIEVRFNTNGKPCEGVDVAIRDPDDGTLLGTGDEGEIFLRTPHPMLGYLDEPEQTRDVLSADGWYRTGDRGVIRSDGNLCLLGRVRDMIRVGGENLAGAEVEAVLLQHPAVKQAAAIPAPDPRLGEIVVAFVELRHDASAGDAELIDFCRAKLAHFKVPRAVHFVTDWPISGTGKMQRRRLLESVAGRTP